MVNLYYEASWSKRYLYKKWFNKIFTTTNQILNLDNNRMVEVSIVSPQEIKRINKTYREKNKITDVISFAFDEVKGIVSPIVGEIYICQDQAVKQASQYHHSLKREICFLFCHGLLHLYGYDHMKPQEEKKMFDLQDKILKQCKIYRETI